MVACAMTTARPVAMARAPQLYRCPTRGTGLRSLAGPRRIHPVITLAHQPRRRTVLAGSSSISSSTSVTYRFGEDGKFDADVELPPTVLEAEPVPAALEAAEEEVAAAEEGGGQDIMDIVRFALPVLGIYVASPLMSTIDTAFVGRTSVLELAALSPSTVLCDLTTFLFTFLTTATTGLVSRALVKDTGDAKDFIAQSMQVAFACGMGMWAILTFATPQLLSLLGATPEIVAPAALYTRIRALSFPAMLVFMSAMASMVGAKDSRTPFNIVALSAGINVVGDFVLCGLLGWGIKGAAVATAFAQGVQVVLILAALSAKGLMPKMSQLLQIPSSQELGPFMGYVGPLSFITLMRVAGFTMMTYFATGLGTAPLAAHQVVFSVFSFFAFFGEPLGQTAQTMLPPLLDAGKLEEARKLMKGLMQVGLVVGALAGAAACATLYYSHTAFTKDPTVIATVLSTLPALFFNISQLPVSVPLDGALVAAKKFNLIIVTTCSTFVGFVAINLWCNSVGMGLLGVWFSSALRVTGYIAIAGVALGVPRWSLLYADRRDAMATAP